MNKELVKVKINGREVGIMFYLGLVWRKKKLT